MDSTTRPNQAKARVGSVLNEKWTLDALLGWGGSAAVYAATHRNGNRAAIKLLHPELAVHYEIVKRFLREAYVANRVGHPGTVGIVDDDRLPDGSVFLVMELLEGATLDRYTKGRETALPLGEVIRLIDMLLDVLTAAHAKAIVHRDIKPGNLMWTRSGALKVLDFGIARLSEGLDDAQVTQTGMSMGTPGYMPPEQARGRWADVDTRTDLWAVGATMSALLLGSRPRRAETVNEELLLAMTQPLPLFASRGGNFPPAICMFIDHAVAFERQHRFPDAGAMRAALREASQGVVVPASSGPREEIRHPPGPLAEPPMPPMANPSVTAILVPPSLPPVVSASTANPPQVVAAPRFMEGGAPELPTTQRPVVAAEVSWPSATPAPARRRPVWAAVMVGLAIGGSVGGFALFRARHPAPVVASEPPPAPTADIAKTADLPPASPSLPAVAAPVVTPIVTPVAVESAAPKIDAAAPAPSPPKSTTPKPAAKHPRDPAVKADPDAYENRF